MIELPKRNLLIFHPYLAPYRIDLYNKLHEDFNLSVLLTGNKNEINTLAFDLKTVNSKSRFKFKYYSKGFYFRRHLISYIYIKEFKSVNPDIVLTHELGFNTIISIIFKRRFQFKLYTTIDDSPDMIKKQSLIRSFLQKIVVRYIDGIFVVNPIVSNILYNKYRYVPTNKFHYLPIIQDDIKFTKHIIDSKDRSNTLINEHKLYGKKIILFVGRLEEVKCPGLLINAFNNLKNKDCCLVIIGGGSLQTKLKENIDNDKKSIILTGPLSGTSLYAWYNIAHVFVLPSKFEPFGAVVNEALIAACFVIVSDVVGSRCLINEKNGAIFKNGDLEDLCNKIEYALKKVPIKKTLYSQMDKSFNSYYEELIEYIGNEN